MRVVGGDGMGAQEQGRRGMMGEGSLGRSAQRLRRPTSPSCQAACSLTFENKDGVVVGDAVGGEPAGRG